MAEPFVAETHRSFFRVAWGRSASNCVHPTNRSDATDPLRQIGLSGASGRAPTSIKRVGSHFLPMRWARRRTPPDAEGRIREHESRIGGSLSDVGRELSTETWAGDWKIRRFFDAGSVAALSFDSAKNDECRA